MTIPVVLAAQLNNENYVKGMPTGDLVKHTRKFPPLQSRSLEWGVYAVYIGNGYFLADESGDELSVLHIPPLASRESTEGWSIPSFPFFEGSTYAAYPPEDVIAVTEEGER